MLTDAGRYDYLPLIDRPKVRWPGGASVAFWVAPNIEFYELDPPDGQGRPLWPRPYPDILSYSLRDYGNRAGVWRMMEALERAAHGLDMGRVLHDARPVSEECGLIEEARDILTRASGLAVKGWHSPGRGESTNTVRLLCENGFEYVADWANDDLPYMMKAEASTICAMSLSHGLADRVLLVHHNRTVEDYERQVLEAFRVLKAEGERYGGRVLSLSPWVIGYPHRIAALERILAGIMESDAVWPATGIAIADAYKQQTGRQTEGNAQA